MRLFGPHDAVGTSDRSVRAAAQPDARTTIGRSGACSFAAETTIDAAVQSGTVTTSALAFASAA